PSLKDMPSEDKPIILASANILFFTSCTKSQKVVNAMSWRSVKMSAKVDIPYNGGENQRGFFDISCSGKCSGCAWTAIDSHSEVGGMYTLPCPPSAITAIRTTLI